MLDETIITEMPPLYSAYGWPGEPILVPISGNRRKRILHGVMNIVTGEVLLLITEDWDQDTHMYFLEMIRSHWRGWHLVLFEDRGSPHKAVASLTLATKLGIEVRLLPRATPELNAMDHLWREVKKYGLGNRPTQTIDESADAACQYIYGLTRQERLRKGGVLSGRFWLAGLP